MKSIYFLYYIKIIEKYLFPVYLIGCCFLVAVPNIPKHFVNYYFSILIYGTYSNKFILCVFFQINDLPRLFGVNMKLLRTPESFFLFIVVIVLLTGCSGKTYLVQTDIDKSSIELDGKPYGLTPLTISELTEGSHHIEAIWPQNPDQYRRHGKKIIEVKNSDTGPKEEFVYIELTDQEAFVNESWIELSLVIGQSKKQLEAIKKYLKTDNIFEIHQRLDQLTHQLPSGRGLEAIWIPWSLFFYETISDHIDDGRTENARILFKSYELACMLSDCEQSKIQTLQSKLEKKEIYENMVISQFNEVIRLLNDNEFDKALTETNKVLSMDPDNKDAKDLLSKIQKQKGLWLQSDNQKKTRIDKHFSEANRLLKLHKYEEAIKELEDILKIDPHQHNVIEKISSIELQKKEKLRYLTDKALAEERKGNHDIAAQLYRRILEIEADYPAATSFFEGFSKSHKLKVNNFISAKDIKNAKIELVYLEKCLHGLPAYAELIGKISKSINQLEKDQIQHINNLLVEASNHEKKGEYLPAIAKYNDVLAIDSENETAKKGELRLITAQSELVRHLFEQKNINQCETELAMLKQMIAKACENNAEVAQATYDLLSEEINLAREQTTVLQPSPEEPETKEDIIPDILKGDIFVTEQELIEYYKTINGKIPSIIDINSGENTFEREKQIAISIRRIEKIIANL